MYDGGDGSDYSSDDDDSGSDNDDSGSEMNVSDIIHT